MDREDTSKAQPIAARPKTDGPVTAVPIPMESRPAESAPTIDNPKTEGPRSGGPNNGEPVSPSSGANLANDAQSTLAAFVQPLYQRPPLPFPMLPRLLPTIGSAPADLAPPSAAPIAALSRSPSSAAQLPEWLGQAPAPRRVPRPASYLAPSVAATLPPQMAFVEAPLLRSENVVPAVQAAPPRSPQPVPQAVPQAVPQPDLSLRAATEPPSALSVPAPRFDAVSVPIARALPDRDQPSVALSELAEPTVPSRPLADVAASDAVASDAVALLRRPLEPARTDTVWTLANPGPISGSNSGSVSGPIPGPVREASSTIAQPAPTSLAWLWRAWRAAFTVAKIGAISVAVWLLVMLALIGHYRTSDPPGSALMSIRWLGGQSIDRTWVPLAGISPSLRRAVLVSEDGQFCRHKGFDFGEIRSAINRGEGFGRGASTITQQLAKNLFLWPDRSYIRKGLEVPLTVMIEQLWPKSRILEVYLNSAEWGPGIFGAEAAARAYFNKPASRLTDREAALLAVALPNPIARDASDPEPLQARLAGRLQTRMRGSLIFPCIGEARLKQQ